VWGFADVDGILGVGPTNLTYNTVPSVYNSTIPTVTDNLKSQDIIDTEALGIYFVPPSTYDSTGELTFGGYDSSKLTGGMNYVPLTTTPPASAYWGINQSITYGSSAIPILYETSGIVDTGTSLILIATGMTYYL
jgi:pepsin A